jgi:hypothetical protein
VLSTFSEVFLCYIDIWFLTYGIRAQGLGVSLLHLRHLGIFAITFFLQRFTKGLDPMVESEEFFTIGQGSILVRALPGAMGAP